MREKYGERVTKDMSQDESRKEWEIHKLKRDARLEECVGDTYRDDYEFSQRERLDNLDQANLEIDTLTKQIEKLQADLSGEQIFNPVFH